MGQKHISAGKNCNFIFAPPDRQTFLARHHKNAAMLDTILQCNKLLSYNIDQDMYESLRYASSRSRPRLNAVQRIFDQV